MILINHYPYSVGEGDGSGDALNAQCFLVFLWAVIYPKNKRRKNKRKGG